MNVMEPLHAWLLVALLSAIAFGTRGSFTVLMADARLPAGLQRGLRFVPAAVFPALVLPDMAWLDGALDLSATNPKLAAGLIAGAVAWRTRSTLATIFTGMAALHAWPVLTSMLAGK